MRLSPINNQNLPPITEFEVENFAWRVNSKDFDLAFDQLTKAYK